MGRAKPARSLLLVVLLVGIGAAFQFRGALDVNAARGWLEASAIPAPLLFVAAYALATVLFLPGSVLTLAGGALFGPVLGTFYSLTGATLGAGLAFLAARYLAAAWVRRRAGGRLRRLLEGVEEEGWRFVAFVRLVPLFPFNLLNYALGLTRIRVVPYVVTSAVCMLPGALAYTWLGYAGRQAAAGAAGAVHAVLIALALLAAALFLPRFVTRLRRGPTLTPAQLKRRLDAGKPLVVLDVRTPREYTGELGHIRGAVNVPVEELLRRLESLAPHRGAAVALVCHTDRRSAKAARLLARAGFSDVHVVRGGMVRWHREGLPVAVDAAEGAGVADAETLEV